MQTLRLYKTLCALRGPHSSSVLNSFSFLPANTNSQSSVSLSERAFHPLGGIAMKLTRSSRPVLAVAIFFAISFSLFLANAKQLPENDLTAHEWGTFTSIAGPDGTSMNWLPLTGSTDLPSFVEHFREVGFKGGLRGTTRMETPVLYFYSPRETAVSVNVSFAKGLITEWYPHADSANPTLTNRDYSLYDKKSPGAIAWNSVHIDPHGSTDFPSDNSENHYFAARNTSSASLLVESPSGTQRKNFLFYRGVSALSVPINAT